MTESSERAVHTRAEEGIWYVTRERFEAVRADGSLANYSVADPDSKLARGYREQGCNIVRRVDVVREAPYMQVILEAAMGASDPEDAVRLMSSDMQRALNMTRDAGRPSDAARSAARAYLSGSLTWDSFNAGRAS